MEFSSTITNPIGFFIDTYNKEGINALKNAIVNDFYRDSDHIPDLQWHIKENKFTYSTFDDDGDLLVHEIHFKELLIKRLDHETKNSIKLLNSNYETIYIQNGSQQAENFCLLQRAKILNCFIELKSIEDNELSKMLATPLDKINDFLTLKLSDLPSSIIDNKTNSKTIKYFKWNVDSPSLELALSKELNTLLYTNGLIGSHSESKIQVAFSGQEVKNPLNISWKALNPRKNQKPSFRSLFFLFNYLEYKDLINVNLLDNRNTSKILQHIFCQADGSQIDLISLKHSKSDYKRDKIDLTQVSKNPNFKKISDVVDQLELFLSHQKHR